MKALASISLVICYGVFFVSPSQAAQTSTIGYAVHSAALSATITYCRIKYRTIRPKSAGEQCFNRARDALQEVDLKAATIRIEHQCPDSATIGTCMTPELGDVVLRILDVFESKNL